MWVIFLLCLRSLTKLSWNSLLQMLILCWKMNFHSSWMIVVHIQPHHLRFFEKLFQALIKRSEFWYVFWNANVGAAFFGMEYFYQSAFCLIVVQIGLTASAVRVLKVANHLLLRRVTSGGRERRCLNSPIHSVLFQVWTWQQASDTAEVGSWGSSFLRENRNEIRAWIFSN